MGELERRQQRATRVIKGLEYPMYEERLGGWGWSAWRGVWWISLTHGNTHCSTKPLEEFVRLTELSFP